MKKEDIITDIHHALTHNNMEKIKYEDLKCEFCNGNGEMEINIDGMNCPTECDFCNSTGIDQDQLQKAILQQNPPCKNCGWSMSSHNNNNNCPNQTFNGWLETKFSRQKKYGRF